jgi:hypothetical protein
MLVPLTAVNMPDIHPFNLCRSRYVMSFSHEQHDILPAFRQPRVRARRCNSRTALFIFAASAFYHNEGGFRALVLGDGNRGVVHSALL